jgi:nucleoside-diphosphate-sugar epimerase
MDLKMKKILVTGAGGFIGFHLVKELVRQGHYVVGADIKYPLFGISSAHEFYQIDLRDPKKVESVISSDIDEIYQLAADMGGTGYIGTGDHDSDIMHNSALININMVHEACKKGIKKILYTSSACVYPERNQEDPSNPLCSEDSVYPAEPDTEYGWEKLFSERLYLAHRKNYNIDAKVVRLHNVFGPQGSWNDGKEKAPAALCRKVAECNTGVVNIWGPGTQTRSFLFIDECIIGLLKIMDSDITVPVNLGSERMISINDLALLIAKIAQKNITINNIVGPIGVMGRTSHNLLIESLLSWRPSEDLEYGLVQTYMWIKEQVNASI